MKLIRTLLEHQYDATKSDAIHDCILTEEASCKLQAINKLLSVEKLTLVVCNAEDTTQCVTIDESTLKYLIEYHN